jgi:hypothetical protein
LAAASFAASERSENPKSQRLFGVCVSQIEYLDLFLGLGSIVGSLAMYWAVMPNEETLWPRWRRVYARIAACQAEFD